MLSNILFGTIFIVVFFILFLGIKRKRLRLYWCRFCFYFTIEHSFYKQLKISNAKEFRVAMQDKRFSTIITDSNITSDIILQECGISNSQVIKEIRVDKYSIFLLEKHVFVLIDPNLFVSAQDCLKVQVLLEYLSKKLRSPLLLIKQQEFLISNESHALGGDEFSTSNNTSDRSDFVMSFLSSSSKIIKSSVRWFTGMNKVPGFSNFKHCSSALPKAMPAYIYSENSTLDVEAEHYFDEMYREISRFSFLGHADQIEGSYVFLEKTRSVLKKCISQQQSIVAGSIKSHKDIIFLNMSTENDCSPLNFIQLERKKTSYAYIISMCLLSLGSIIFISQLLGSYQHFKSWENNTKKNLSQNFFNSSDMSKMEREVNDLKLSNFYSDKLMSNAINNKLARSFAYQVIIPKIKSESNLSKKGFLLLLTESSYRPILSKHSTLIADYLGLKDQKVALNALLNSDITIDQSKVPTVEYKSLLNPNQVTLTKNNSLFYQSYYRHLLDDQTTNYKNFINFSVNYALPIRVNILTYKLVEMGDKFSQLSKENINFLKTLTKNPISLTDYLVAPKVLVDIRSVSDLKDISINKFIQQSHTLINDYNQEKTSDDVIKQRSSAFLKSAIISYVSTYSEYMIAHSIPAISATDKEVKMSEIQLINLGDYHLKIPVAYTKGYYTNIQNQINALDKLNSILQNKGFKSSGQEVLKLKNYINATYVKSYIQTYDNLINSLGDMNLSKQDANEIMQTYALSDSQFYNTLKLISQNTTFNEITLKKNKLLLTINDHFSSFDKAVVNKEFINKYQLIIENMQSQYFSSKDSNRNLLDTMLTFIDVPAKSPLLKVDALLNKNYLPVQYHDIFTLPVTQALTSLKPFLYEYMVQSWRKNITPQIVASSAYYPFNAESTNSMGYNTFTKKFGPSGTINEFINRAYLPFLTKKDGKYKIKLINNKDLPKNVRQILSYINSYKTLSTELWSQDGKAKSIELEITPIPIPEKVIYPNSKIYAVATFFNLNKHAEVNLSQEQSPLMMNYDWSALDKTTSVGWLDNKGNVKSLSSAQGTGALFSILKTANKHIDNTYYWKVKTSNAEVGFTFNSPIFQFINEVKNYDSV